MKERTRVKATPVRMCTHTQSQGKQVYIHIYISLYRFQGRVERFGHGE